MPLRVFISYSTKEDAEAQALLVTVRTALEGAGHCVFIDKEKTPPGYPWRQRILSELMHSHVGVILFTRGALTSPWVLYEAQMMSIGRELSTRFTVIPVLLQDVGVKDLQEAPFTPLALDQLQFTQARTAEALAQELLDWLARIPQHDTHLEALSMRIDAELSELPQKVLDYVASELGLEATWRPDGGRIAFAHALARLVMSEGMDGVYTIINALTPFLRSQKAQSLLDILAPLWVHMDAAAYIPWAVKRRSPSWCVGINGKRVFRFTDRLFLDRAYWPKRRELIHVSGGAGEDLVEHIRAEIIGNIKASRNFESEEEAQDYLQQTSEAIFVSLPRKLWDKDSLRILRDTYPHVIFILDTGEVLLAEDHPTLPSEFKALPPVDSTAEQQAWRRYGDAKGVIKNYP